MAKSIGSIQLTPKNMVFIMLSSLVGFVSGTIALELMRSKFA